MKRMILAAFSVALLLVPAATAQELYQETGAKKKPPATPAPAPKPAEPSLAEKLVQMVKLKMPDAVILNTVRTAGDKARLSADELIRLKEAGASDALLLQLVGSPAAAVAAKPSHETQAPPSAITPPAAVAAAPPGGVAAAPPPPGSYNTDLGTLRCVAPAGQNKRVIAVRNFDFGTVTNAKQSVFNLLSAIGKGITALAVKRLQDGGKYRIVERENLQAVLAEQNFGDSGRVRAGSQTKLGRILGADAILMGTITTFGRDDDKKSIGGGGYAPSWLAGARVKWGKDKAVVAISFRLVDAETSETLAVGEARGESTRKSKSFDFGAATGGGGGAGGLDMSASNFAETIIGEATINCMNKLIEELNGKAVSIRVREAEVTERIAEVAGQQIYISGGASSGVQRCDRFEVNRVLKEILDPVTRQTLDVQVEKVGEMLVTDVRERMAIGFYNGTAPPLPGYQVRKIIAPEK